MYRTFWSGMHHKKCEGGGGGGLNVKVCFVLFSQPAGVQEFFFQP